MKKQKILPSLLMMGLMMVVSPSTFSVSASSGYGGGSGTQSDPYLISTPDHLNQLQLDVNVNKVNTSGKYYKLTDNIDLSGYDNDSDETNGNFMPIGNSSATFKGIFDGNGKVISNMEMILPEQNYAGLFGYTSSATIRNLRLESIVIEGNQYVGGVVGYQKKGLVEKIGIAGEVIGDRFVGGLVGSVETGRVVESYVEANVVAKGYTYNDYTYANVGGLLGTITQSDTVIENNYVVGSVSGVGWYVGGLVGRHLNGSVVDNYSIAVVSGNSLYVGGLIGDSNYTSQITNNYFDIEKSEQSVTNGIYPVRTVGFTTHLAYIVLEGFDFQNIWVLCEGGSPKLRWQVDSCQEIDYVPSLFEESGTNDDPYLISRVEDLIYMSEMVEVGGRYPLKSYRLTHDIDFSNYDNDDDESNGNFTPIGKSSSISFKGVFDGNRKVISNLKVVLPEQKYVGVFGYTSSATIRNVRLENIVIEGKEYVGGLVGYQGNGTISECFTTGDIFGNGSYVGGLVGYQTGSSANILSSGVEVSVKGVDRVGGLVGQQYGKNATIFQSFSSGEVEGNNYVGGFIGQQYADGKNNAIKESYSTSSVKGKDDVGGFVGGQSSRNYDESLIEDCYATGDVSGSSNYVGGFVGYKGTGVMRRNYSTGNKRFVGENRESDTLTDSYWNIDTGGTGSGKGVYSVRSEGMTTELAYHILEGFDFENTWILCEGEYPQLHWQVDSCQEIQHSRFLLEGDGTEESPYLISTPDDLIYMSRLVNVGGRYPSKYYQLLNSINLLGHDNDFDEVNGNFMPIGDSLIPFNGSFNGNEYVVSNIEILLSNQDYVGVFGYTSSATIKNITLENIVIEGKRYVGGLVGYRNYGTISGGCSKGNVSGSGDYVGGLVGYQNGGTINQSCVEGGVNGSGDYVGGLVGYQKSGTISQSYSMSNVVGGSYYNGGLVGYQESGTVTQSYAIGEVSGSGYYVGGLVGYQNSSSCVITQSYATGSVSGNQRVGGLVGVSGGKINQSYATGSVSGNQRVGGLVGQQYSGAISQSYATGLVKGSTFVGGLVGYQSGGTISESYSTGRVSQNSGYLGGLVGNQSGGTTVSSYWDVETSGQSSSDGGIGLTTKQMTKRKAKDNMVGFDFDTVWQESNGYPLLHWQTPDPISGEESDLTVNGNIEATILSLTIPSSSMTFALNPNEEVGKQFVASDFELINGSQTPLTLEVKTFEQVTDVLTDVEPTKYSDWTGLNKIQSKDIALALAPKVGDGWLTLNEGNRWVANLGELNIGTIKGNSTVSFGFEAKHGSSFTETLTPQYRLTFVFGLQD